MTDQSLEELLKEHPALRQRLEEAEAVMRAIHSGEVDAVFIDANANQSQVYTLETAEKPYRIMVEQMPQAAATLTEEGVIIYCNRRFADLLRRPLQSLLGKPFQDFVAPESRARVTAMLHAARDAETRDEVDLQPGDGPPSPVFLGMSALREGAFGLCLMVTDLTEQRHYIELQKAQRALAVVTERLELAQEAGQIGTFDRSLTTGMIQWSASQERLYGLVPGSFGGRYEEWKRMVHPLDRARADRDVTQAVEHIHPLETEFRIVRPDGEVRWIACKGKVVCDASGKAIRVVGINQDITERKAAVDELREAASRKDEFLATLAHELRNPLAPIATAVELMELTGSISQTQREALAMIRRQTAQLTRLVDDLLDVSRITRGIVNLRSAPIDPAEVLQEAAKATERLIRHKRHRLTTVTTKEPLRVLGDEARLIQVFTNLLNNAAKYTPEGGKIEVHLERAGRQAVIRVRDNGIGIEPLLLERIFNLFEQGDRPLARSEGGLGIGLTLVRKIVELHQGGVVAHSAGRDQGCEIEVRLPLCDESIQPPPPDRPVAAPASSLRILVVDDNVDAASSMSSLLALSGHEVKTQLTGTGALTAALAWQPEVVLLDIGLPGMDGYEVARELRGRGYKGFIAALTGYGQEADRAKSAAAGFDLHLVKPVDFDKLRRVLAGKTAGKPA